MSDKKSIWNHPWVLGTGVVVLASILYDLFWNKQAFLQFLNNLISSVLSWLTLLMIYRVPLWFTVLSLILWTLGLVVVLRHGTYKSLQKDSPFGERLMVQGARPEEPWLSYTQTDAVAPWRFKWHYLPHNPNPQDVHPVCKNDDRKLVQIEGRPSHGLLPKLKCFKCNVEYPFYARSDLEGAKAEIHFEIDRLIEKSKEQVW